MKAAGEGGLVRRIDDGIFRVEQAFVTVAALVMTLTVTLDIVYRAFATPESQLARKLLVFLGLFGVEKSPANYETLRDYASPFVLGLLTFLVGWAIYTAGRKQVEKPAAKSIGMLWGAATVVGGYGLIQVIVQAPSKWVCAGFLVLGCGVYAVHALKIRDWLGVILALTIAVLGSWAAQTLPEQYIWSQELSLILLAWMAFIGASMATRMSKHIQVDALSRLIPRSLRPWSRAVGLLATTIFCVYMSYLAYEHVFGPQGDFGSGEVRPSTRIPAWTIVLSVWVAFTLMSIRFGAQAIDAFLRPRIIEAGITH